MTTTTELTKRISDELRLAKKECGVYYNKRAPHVLEHSGKIATLVFDSTDLNSGDEPYKKMIADEFDLALAALQEIYHVALAKEPNSVKKQFHRDKITQLESLKIHFGSNKNQKEPKVNPEQGDREVNMSKGKTLVEYIRDIKRLSQEMKESEDIAPENENRADQIEDTCDFVLGLIGVGTDG